MNTLTIPMIQGVDQEVNSRLIQNTSAQDCLNTIYEEGKIKSRYGMRSLLSEADRLLITEPKYYDNGTENTAYASIKEIYTYVPVNTTLASSVSLFVFTDYFIWKRTGTTLSNWTPRVELSGGTRGTSGSNVTFTYQVSALPSDYAYIEAGSWLIIDGKNYRVNAVRTYTTGINPDIITWFEITIYGILSTSLPTGAFLIKEQTDVSDFQYSIDTYYDTAKTALALIYCNGGQAPALWYYNSPKNYFQYADSYIYTQITDTDKTAAIAAIKSYTWKYLCVYGGRLIASDGVQTIAFSGPGMNVNSKYGYLDFRAAYGSGYVQLVNSNDQIVGFKKYRNLMWVFKQDSITEVLDSQDFREPFIFNENKINSGTFSIRTVVEIDSGLLFLSKADILIFDGMNARAISDKVKTRVFNTINYDSMPHCFSINMETFHTAVIFYCNGTGTIDLPRVALAYNYKYDLWSFWDFSNINQSIGFTGGGVWLTDPAGDNYPTWDSDEFADLTWDDISGRLIWGDTTFSNLRPVYSWACKTTASIAGRLYRYDKSTSDDEYAVNPIYCNVTTKDFDLGDVNTHKHLTQLTLLMSALTPFNIAFSMDMGRTWCGQMDVPTYGDDPHTPIYAGESAEMVDRTLNLMLKGKRCRVRIMSNSRSRFEIESLTFRWNYGGIGTER